MKAVGYNPDTNLVEIMEIPDHPWFVGAKWCWQNQYPKRH